MSLASDSDRQVCCRDGCNQPHDGVFWVFCSEECRRLQNRLTFERVDARLDDRDPPTIEDLLGRKGRAKRWTPETMAEYLEQFDQ